MLFCDMSLDVVIHFNSFAFGTANIPKAARSNKASGLGPIVESLLMMVLTKALYNLHLSHVRSAIYLNTELASNFSETLSMSVFRIHVISHMAIMSTFTSRLLMAYEGGGGEAKKPGICPFP
jgi:hypothetical protein